ncbi:MAG: hypothetical protein WDN06_00645 [Asticcacaulis sp.]
MITLHYEARFGLARGAVYKDGKPHLYLEGYENDPSLAVVGTRSVARLEKPGRGHDLPHLGRWWRSGARCAGGCQAQRRRGGRDRDHRRGRGRRRLARGEVHRHGGWRSAPLSPMLSLQNRLLARASAIFGDAAVERAADRDAISEASEQAANPSGPLANGGQLWIEATRALIACDVDAAEAGSLNPGRNFAAPATNWRRATCRAACAWPISAGWSSST